MKQLRRVGWIVLLSAGLLATACSSAQATQYLPPGITCNADQLVAAARHPNPGLMESLVGIGDFDQVLTELESQCVDFGTLSPRNAVVVNFYRTREVAIRIHRLFPGIAASPWHAAVAAAGAAYRGGKPVWDPLASRNFMDGIVEGTSVQYLPPADSLAIVVRDLDHAAHALLDSSRTPAALRAVVVRTERDIHRMSGVPLAARVR